MTEKLYYTDSHIFEFEATVLACEASKRGYEIILDKTAFFPEGGGQSADTGSIGPAKVTDVREKDDIIHYTDSPLAVGESFHCVLDREQRLRRMQNHSGEHIVSGLVHRLYGYDNVGFHMGSGGMTIDFSGELDALQLREVETMANEAVRANVPVLTYFPSAEEMVCLEYRSKLELTHDVRIVEISGIDRCACCAPHVSRTGEIGIIKLLDFMRHRGGVRVSLVCGMDALDMINVVQDNNDSISAMLSAQKHETASALERVMNEKAAAGLRCDALSRELVKMKLEAEPATEGNICMFDNLLNDAARRELINGLTDKCNVAAVFSGSDEEGYSFIMGSRRVNLRDASRAICAGINGRGGGSAEMISGRAKADASTIRTFVGNIKNSIKI